MSRRDAEQVAERRVDVDVGRERVGRPGRDAGRAHEQRRVAERLVDRAARLAPDVLLAEEVAVVGADDHGGVVTPAGPVERVEEPAEPRVDHRELRAVLRADLAAVALGEHALLDPADGVRRPDEMARAVPIGVVHRRVRLRRVERLVRIELVDEQQEASVVGRLLLEPARRLAHDARAGEVVFAAEPAPRVVVGRVHPAEQRRADPRRVGARAPRVALVAALVVPRGEVDVVVLAAGLEQVRDGR